MRVLVAPGPFGRLGAGEAASAIANAWREASPHVEVVTAPQADGGIGTAQVLGSAQHAQPIVVDAEGAAVPAFLSADRSRAWIDSAEAEAAGGEDSASLGAAVASLLADGVRTLVIGLGGVRSLDGGRGFVRALAGSADADGVRRARELLADTTVTAVANTDRQLLGFHGACYPAIEELGLDKTDAQAAEQAMGEWLDVVRAAIPARRDLLQGKPIRPEKERGAGAAGGLGFLLFALGAQLVAGPTYVAGQTGLAEKITHCDLVVTATQVFDWRVLEHSVLAEVTSAAATAATPAVVLADEVHVGRREQMSLGVQGAYSVNKSGWMRPVPASAAELAESLPGLARRVAGTWTPPPRTDVP